MDDDSFEIVPGPTPVADEADYTAYIEKKEKKKFVHPKKTAEERKKEKESRRSRKARIILRNISYKTSEKNLTERFAKYGTIKECNILKRADGKLVGCAFIQYEKVNQAAKAIHHENAKEFLGRPVVIDWAVNRKKFTDHQKKSRKAEVKVENSDDDDDDDASIKSEPHSDEEDAEGDDSEAEESDSDAGSDDENDDDDDDDGDDDDTDEDEKDEKKPIHKRSNDVAEGCTVFIKNVPFEATSADLRKVCSQFGPLYYAVITTDKISGHSKGTGFVKYKTKESADMCLSAGTSFKLLDQVLDPHAALSRHEIQQKAEGKKKEPADSRNLYLAKEGLVVTGTPAAEGVSQSDIAKRLRLEQSKSQMLKNLNRFVSKERLTVHNIPPSYDSTKLRNVVIKACGRKPKECRIMRENKPSMGQPLGKSKGYGFLSFAKHEDALHCLRKVNNNPHVFGKNNRPIVAFSVEDRAVHNLKMKRLQRSKECNPLCKTSKSKKSKDKKTNADVKPNLKKLKPEKKPKTDEIPVAEFAGVTSEKGSQYKTRPLWKLREEATTHGKTTGDEKKAQKKRKQEAALRREKQEIERPKQGKRKAEVDSTLVNKYLRMLHANDSSNGQPKTKRSKWYTE